MGPRARSAGRLAFGLAAVLIGLALPAAATPAPAPMCRAGTAMVVVAHPDDDLLFLSPDLLHDIHRGQCVRTVYLTAGNANRGASYWQRREAGEKAAYARMAAVPNAWTRADAGLPGHPIPVYTLAARPGISLAFLRLPDGIPDGSGGSRNGFESLQKLWSGTIPAMHPVDGSSAYSRQELVDALALLMATFRADRIDVLDYAGAFGDGDHSDHHASAYFARAAHRQYAVAHVLVGYLGYKISALPVNVTGGDYAAKRDAYLAYAADDPASCQTEQSCLSSRTGTWWSRQYQRDTETGGGTTPNQTVPGSLLRTGLSPDTALIVRADPGASAGPAGSCRRPPALAPTVPRSCAATRTSRTASPSGA